MRAYARSTGRPALVPIPRRSRTSKRTSLWATIVVTAVTAVACSTVTTSTTVVPSTGSSTTTPPITVISSTSTTITPTTSTTIPPSATLPPATPECTANPFGDTGGWSSIPGAGDVLVVIQLDDGTIWAGGEFGAVRWNADEGCRWFDARSGLGSNIVTDLVVDDAGTVWFGTTGGITRYDGVAVTTYVPDLSVRDLTAGTDGTLWAAGDGGVAAIDDDTVTRYTTDDGLVAPKVVSVAVAGDGTVYASTQAHEDEPGRSAFMRLDDRTWIEVPSTDVYTRFGWGDRLLTDPTTGDVWALAFTGSCGIFDGTAWTAGPTAPTGLWWGETAARWASFAEDGTLLVGTPTDGAFRLTGTMWEHVVSTEGAVLAVAATDDDILVGARAEVRRLGPRPVTFDIDSPLPSSDVGAVAVAPDGTLWVGTAEGLATFDGETWSRPPIDWDVGSIAFAGDEVFAAGEIDTFDLGIVPRLAWFDGSAWTERDDIGRLVAVAGDGTVWSVTRGGYDVPPLVRRIAGTTSWQPVDGPAGIVALAAAKDGSVWVGDGDGLMRYRDGAWESFSRACNDFGDGVRGPGCVTTVAVAGDGTVWTGSAFGGVGRLDGNSWENFTADGLDATYVTAIGFDPDGRAWIGTLGDGIAHQRSGDDWEWFTTADGLPANDIGSIAVAGDGTVWVGTLGGLARWTPER